MREKRESMTLNGEIPQRIQAEKIERLLQPSFIDNGASCNQHILWKGQGGGDKGGKKRRVKENEQNQGGKTQKESEENVARAYHY